MGIKNPAVTILRVVGIIFIIVAVINIVVGGIMFFVSKSYDDKYKDAYEITATVEKVVYSSSKNSSSNSSEIYVDYELEGKSYHHVKLVMTINANDYTEGDTMTIYVPKDDPKAASMSNTAVVFYIIFGVFGGIGVFFLIISIVLLIVAGKIKKKAKTQPFAYPPANF